MRSGAMCLMKSAYDFVVWFIILGGFVIKSYLIISAAVKPVYNDHLYDKIYYRFFIQ